MIGGEPYTLGLFDSAGQEDFDRLRPLSYPGTDIFLVCFSVVAPISFENVQESYSQWIPELAHYSPNIPFLLVGTQVDQRYERTVVDKLARNRQKPITKEMGDKLARDLEAVQYVECSALTQVRFFLENVSTKGLKAVFDEAFMAVLEPKTRRIKERKCKIL
ncbi:unnamed protein product [Cylicostephanus goldi]|uniref:Uncharacterized protein n=1 Tax=Cylicostephanus goldi TaxID=71465 RepID=A0A3P7N3C4_CYLGO|nr:unnamed protein product [Cylicostephanus goldi]